MKKFYQNPEIEIIELNTEGFLAASLGEEGGESTGKVIDDDKDLDDLLGDN